MESDGEQPLSDSVAHLRQPSARSAVNHRRVSPSSAARLRQGSYRSRDARDDYVDVAAEAERTRRVLEEAQATTLRRKGRLLELHRRIAAAESEERKLPRRQQMRNSL